MSAEATKSELHKQQLLAEAEQYLRMYRQKVFEAKRVRGEQPTYYQRNRQKALEWSRQRYIRFVRPALQAAKAARAATQPVASPVDAVPETPIPFAAPTPDV